jgi:hypothetical protein
MGFDDRLAQRIRKELGSRKGISEKRMFGGLAFLLNGNMCCGVHQRELIVRLDADRTELALAQPHTRIFDLSGRPMQGWILVAAAGLEDDDMLAKWINVAVNYVSALPGK